MYFLEKVCSAQLALMAAAGGRIRRPSSEVCEHTARQYENEGHGDREWPALLRQLDSVTTDYKR